MSRKTGRIKKYISIRGFGFIKTDEGGDDLFFHISSTWKFNGDPQEGDEVTFKTRPGRDGKPVAVDVQPRSEQQQEPTYRFLNPYNFVRWLPVPGESGKPKQADPSTTALGSALQAAGVPQVDQTSEPTPKEFQLLSRCTPPPHDRWIGLSGKITCEIEAMTPLFVSDSDPEPRYQNNDDKKADHKTYAFFKYDFGEGEKHAIPAASLRGMIRNVFETVTNSCYAHFDYEKRLSYHLPAGEALKLVPARIEKSKDDKSQWQLRLLPGSARLSIGSRPRDMLYPARLEQYQSLRRMPTGRRKVPPPKVCVDLGGRQHSKPCYALLRRRKFPPVWNVVKIAENPEVLEQEKQSDDRVRHGYLCLNNQNIENKRFERFFFRDPENTFGEEYVPLPGDVRAKYIELIKDYRERHAPTIQKLNKQEDYRGKLHLFRTKWKNGKVDAYEPAFSRFIIERNHDKIIKDGELVYAMLSGTAESPSVEFLVPVAVPRVGFERKVSQLLPQHLWKCDHYDHLCPACRTFGWVQGLTADDDKKKRASNTAYAGRVQLQHAELQGEVSLLNGAFPLAILSSPKPTTTYFYLKPANGKPQAGLDEWAAGYDNPDNVLRGRKFYRHHGHSGDAEYWRKNNQEYCVKDDKRSDQNRSVADAVAPETRFTFDLRFDNLAGLELGALLWSLEMDGKAFHRLGYAKPLGFGTVRVTVSEVELHDASARYGQDWRNKPEMLEGNKLVEWKAQWLEVFKNAMARTYGESFESLEHVEDLLCLLGEPQKNLPIHYPRSQKDPREQANNFEWFMGNKRNRDARHVLDLPCDEKGLPLLDKRGDEVET